MSPSPKMTVHIRREAGLMIPFQLSQLRLAAQTALRHQGIDEPCELTIYLTDDAHIRELNRSFLGVDSPTDVLSFPAAERDPHSGRVYLGDIILSVQRVLEQSQAAGHPPQAEAQLLIVHGVLHLLGHDHAEPAEKQRMWEAQGEILKLLGWDPSIVREEHP
ncbi:MAG: rRNA maturation RNase YbeY [Anaerolineales bacterium]